MKYSQSDNKLWKVSNPFLSREIGELGNNMIPKKGALSAGGESNIVGHLMPQSKVSQHKVSEEKSQMEINSPQANVLCN